MKMMDISSKLQLIHKKIIAASKKRTLDDQHIKFELVAVSKFHPIDAIIIAYEAGQRHFGENFVNELSLKASNAEILDKCTEIKWHFIGHVQKSNINTLLKVPNLHIIQTVDSEKIAYALNNSWPKYSKFNNTKLKIMIQVNTSKERAKSGCQIENVSSIVKYICDRCLNLEFLGLMTIGKNGYDTSNGPNPDFLILKECRTTICKELHIQPQCIELSMGMSTDFEHAIELGSSCIRVGTGIFGERKKI